MRNLWSGAAVALALGAMSGCASPHYPIEEGQAPGPAPLTQPKPQYPIDPPSAQSAAAPAAAAAPAEPPAPAPQAAPVAPVDSQPLPPPAAPSSFTGPSGGMLQPAALTSADATPTAPIATTPTSTAPSSSTLPAAAPAPAPAATPVSSVAATPATSPAATATTPAVAPEATPPSEPAMTPQAVTHDEPAAAPAAAPAPIREASAAPTYRPASGHFAVDGRVVDASGEIFESYEVQRGDHIDALARAFSTTRTILLEANDIRAPYVIRPGQIIKVPVAKAYVAQGGDTLAGVARRFSVGVGELAQINDISDRAVLRPGAEIGLPSSMRDRGPLPLTGGEAEYARTEPAYSDSGAHQPYVPGPPQQPHITQVSPAEPTMTQDHGTANYAGAQPPGTTAQASFGMSDAQIAQAARGRFVWPVQGDILTRFGPQGVGRRNDGLDIKAPSGTVVKAAAPGEVVYAGDQVPGFGNLVLIKHADGWVTAYAHLDQVNVQMKQQVTQGQAVGSVGTTGGVDQPELHFEVRYAPSPEDKARPVDPVLVLPVG